MFIHVQLQLSAKRAQTKITYIINNLAYLTSWYKEQLRLKILKKLRIANLNSEFTGSYKKSVLRTD